MSNYAWFKIWAVGNGGQECFTRYVELYKHKDEDDMQYDVEEALPLLPGGIRSIHWEEVQYLPDEFLDEKIKHQQWIIENGAEAARKKIIELEKMRKPKETNV